MATTQAMLDAQQALLESSEALRAAFDANISAMNTLTRELSRQVANKPEPQEMFVTPREVADLLHKNEQTVRRMCRDGSWQAPSSTVDAGSSTPRPWPSSTASSPQRSLPLQADPNEGHGKDGRRDTAPGPRSGSSRPLGRAAGALPCHRSPWAGG